MKKYLQLIRVKHWIKNFLIFIPMICAKILNYHNLYITLVGFFIFSFASSFIYIINDIRDIEKDKLHPRKKKRPLPSGKVKVITASVIAIVLLALAVGLNVFIIKNVFSLSLYILMAYILINIAYSFGLKDIAIIDIVLLASGFVLRVYYGAAIIDVNVSNWLFLTVMSASLFLGLGKRKKEFVHNKNARAVLKEYNEEFLDKFQYICLSLMVVFYSLWAIEQSIKFIVFTIPLLIIIFMRYCLIIEKSDEGDPTTIIYSDKFLLISCVIYGLIMLLLLVG